MPGIKSIIWNDGTDAQLLKALVAVLNTSVNEAQAQEIAKLMGSYSWTPEPGEKILTHGSQAMV